MNTTMTYSDLKQELEREGCFKTAPAFAIVALIGNLSFSIVFFLLTTQASHFLISFPLFILGSFFFYRLGWLMHDAAHGGTFETPAANNSFASLTAGILGEFPSGWRYGHSLHHAHTNIRGKDLDQRERWDTTRRYTSRWKAWLGLFSFTRIKSIYFPHTLLFLMLRDGYYCYKFRNQNFKKELFWVAISFITQVSFFIILFGNILGPLLFFVHTHIGMIYLNMIFAANHYDLPNYTPEEAQHFSFEELQALTTRNYTGGFLARFIYGGLEKQLEHHLFPNLPRHNLKKAGPIVRRYCERRGFPYNEENYLKAFEKVLSFHVDEKHL